MSYRYYRKPVKRETPEETPPDTYKFLQPTLGMFGLNHKNQAEIERSYIEYRQKKEKLERFTRPFELLAKLLGLVIVIAPYIFGISIIRFIYGVIRSEFFGLYSIPLLIDIRISFIGLLIYLIVFGIIALSGKISKKNTSKKPKERTEYDRIVEYRTAISQFRWWQIRKREDFWKRLTGREFEVEIMRLWESKGYYVTLSKQGGDGGIDLIARRNSEVIAIQCKAHKNKISPSVARDLFGTITSKRIRQGYLITLNGGTSGTIEFCRRNHIKLWKLIDILEFQDKR